MPDTTQRATVVVVHGRTAEVLGADGASQPVRLAPGLALTPVAGDEVVVADGRLVEVLPRRTQLTRPDPNGHELQVLAANVDLVLLVAPADHGQREGALERMAIMAWDSGATPLVVLTKADLADDPDARLERARDAAPGVEVLLTSTVDGRGLDALRSRLGPGTTATMLGASGAGKTSLLNALEGLDEATREVRADGEGRHTTTTRRLFRLGSGGTLLDLPGVRNLDLHASEQGVATVYADVADLAAECRFADCAHDTEPGCAVTGAVADGALSPRRLEGWRAAQRELAYLHRRTDPAARAAKLQEWKRVTRESRGRQRP
ncbi:ribosome small subunit-dependent GTPase A [Nocardioides sp. CFH 31398]|uniref:ribosome small subunit-dependent GTPase A n=1 Tax=Nocardioides sp. CFH 31398 TaxID=2919579 RepID=UPI001F06556F|nr:ribosome small subunit-dependent GTPase A [Nocardioides sp. CFH 31398]MCH1865113.1 ribosome small subunit-dependent GTPase A [Nocardioides sp. CFH 31398]